ncbi:MAG: hypothetical protein JNK73_03445 [Bacteroidia bacterium]|nr:hypothetical protein [Bacteroidia bacterium]
MIYLIFSRRLCQRTGPPGFAGSAFLLRFETRLDFCANFSEADKRGGLTADVNIENLSTFFAAFLPKHGPSLFANALWFFQEGHFVRSFPLMEKNQNPEASGQDFRKMACKSKVNLIPQARCAGLLLKY